MAEKFDKVAYNTAYNKENYYRLNIVLPKDMRSIVEEAAKSAGMSKNAWFKEAIEEKLARQGR